MMRRLNQFKIKLLSILLISSVTSAIYAQSEIGIVGGVNWLRLEDKIVDKNNAKDYMPLSSYTGSLIYNEYLNERFFIGLGLEVLNIHSYRSIVSNIDRVTVKGSKTTYYSSQSSSSVTLDLRYLNLHLTVGMKLFAIKRIESFIAISPYWGHLGRAEIVGSRSSYYDEYTVDSLGQISNNHSGGKGGDINFLEIPTTEKNLGVSVSLGLRISLNAKLAVILRPSYSLGFLNALENDTYTYTNVKGYSVAGGLTYRFGKGIFRKKNNETDNERQ